MPGQESPTRSAKMFTVQGGRCPWCWRPLPENLASVQTDLIIPVIRGGLNTEWNQQLLHAACRAERHTADRGLTQGLATPPARLHRFIPYREPRDSNFPWSVKAAQPPPQTGRLQT